MKGINHFKGQFEKAGSVGANIGKSAMKQIEYLTYKNKLVAGITKNATNVYSKMLKSDDPFKELGPGITSYH